MLEIVVCIGSNVENANRNVCDALSWLSDIFDHPRYTPPYATAPEGENAGLAKYTNAVFFGQTSLPIEQITDMFKIYEREHGRIPAHKTMSHIIIDIDLVCYGGEVIDAREYGSDYFIAGYTRLLRQ